MKRSWAGVAGDVKRGWTPNGCVVFASMTVGIPTYGSLTDAISPRSLRCSPKFN
jgi:hypothetical protein